MPDGFSQGDLVGALFTTHTVGDMGGGMFSAVALEVSFSMSAWQQRDKFLMFFVDILVQGFVADG